MRDNQEGTHMASEMMEALMMLCQEKHIDELYLLDPEG